MDIVTEKWNEIIENLRLEHSLSDVSFKTWILPLKVYDVIENTVYILVTLDGTGDYIDYIEKKYLLPFKVSIAEITGIEYDVKFIPDNPSELEKVEEERRKEKVAKRTIHAVSKGTASNEMCTFLIMNISSLQLIPVNIIAYRSQYHSTSPAAVTGPCFAATMVSTLAAVIFCKIMDHLRNPT